MKSKLIQRLTIFLDRRSHNWQQRLCLITFLMLSLSVILAGVPMHIIGLIGTESSTLYAISAIMWVATVVITTLYMQQRLSLTVAISAFGIIAQLMGSARIVYMAMRSQRVLKILLYSTRLSRSPLSYILSWLLSDMCQR